MNNWLKVNFIKIFLLTSMALLALGLLSACGDKKHLHEPQLLTKSIISQLDGSKRNYFVYLPKGYQANEDKRWPVMLFLHGNGERGNGTTELDYVLTHGPIYEAWIQKRDLPFIIISPQLPLFGFDLVADNYFLQRKPSSIPQRLRDGVPARVQESKFIREIPSIQIANNMDDIAPLRPKGWEMIEQDLLLILDETARNFQTDQSRVYLTGLSYGGFGTWYMASQHPEKFAAIVPVAGWGHPSFMPSIAEKNIPVWVFAGGLDPVIKIENFYPGINRLLVNEGNQVRFTVHQDAGHDVWRRVYQSEQVYQWLLEHSLEARK